MSIPMQMITNVLRIRAYGKPFYAADLRLNGGEINGLARNGYIRPTGNTRTTMVKIDNHLFKECEIKEWECSPHIVSGCNWWKEHETRMIKSTITYAKFVLEAARLLDLEGI